MNAVTPGNLDLIRRVLGDAYLSLTLQELTVKESVVQGTVATVTDQESTNDEPVFVTTGKGVGVVDAVFHALLERYAREFGSLHSIELAGFWVLWL